MVGGRFADRMSFVLIGSWKPFRDMIKRLMANFGGKQVGTGNPVVRNSKELGLAVTGET